MQFVIHEKISLSDRSMWCSLPHSHTCIWIPSLKILQKAGCSCWHQNTGHPPLLSRSLCHKDTIIHPLQGQRHWPLNTPAGTRDGHHCAVVSQRCRHWWHWPRYAWCPLRAWTGGKVQKQTLNKTSTYTIFWHNKKKMSVIYNIYTKLIFDQNKLTALYQNHS